MGLFIFSFLLTLVGVTMVMKARERIKRSFHHDSEVTDFLFGVGGSFALIGVVFMGVAVVQG